MDENPTCAHCGDPLSRRGTSDATGARYCSTKRECRRARDRAAYRRRFPDVSDGVEDRPCSHCGAELPARPKRPTDDPIGRWCRDSKPCRTAKAKAPSLERQREFYRLGAASHERFFAAEPTICDCGAEGPRVRLGFAHPSARYEGSNCTHLGLSAVASLPLTPPDGVEPCSCRSCTTRRADAGL